MKILEIMLTIRLDVWQLIQDCVVLFLDLSRVDQSADAQ